MIAPLPELVLAGDRTAQVQKEEENAYIDS